MKVLHVNHLIDPSNGGGTAERTFQMSRFLSRAGVECTLLTLNLGISDERLKELEGDVKVVALPCLNARFFVPWVRRSVLDALVADADVVQLVGHWTILNARVYAALRRAKGPYVVCPAGALPLFGRSAWMKRLYNLLVGRALIRNAAAWIAVTAGEFSHFESYGVATSRVAVIPNGVNVEDFPITDRQAFLDRHGLPDAPLILFMGRLAPIKGPDLLLRAYIQARKNIPDYHLVFAGPDGGMLKGLMTEAEQAGVSGSVHFIGYVRGEDKASAYQHARLLVVPSRQEAMSIVALEAGICGTPVLVTDQCGFSEVRQVDSRLEVPATVEGIAAGMTALLGNPQLLQQISPVWKSFVEKRYAWSNIVNAYLTLYRKVTSLPARS